jgi:hypothetical protein
MLSTGWRLWVRYPPNAGFILRNLSQRGPLGQVRVGPARQVPRVSGGISVSGAGGSRSSGTKCVRWDLCVRCGWVPLVRCHMRTSVSGAGGSRLSGATCGWDPRGR